MQRKNGTGWNEMDQTNNIPEELAGHLMAIAKHCEKQRPPCSECDLFGFCPIAFNYSPAMWEHLIKMDRIGDVMVETYDDDLRGTR